MTKLQDRIQAKLSDVSMRKSVGVTTRDDLSLLIPDFSVFKHGTNLPWVPARRLSGFDGGTTATPIRNPGWN